MPDFPLPALSPPPDATILSSHDSIWDWLSIANSSLGTSIAPGTTNFIIYAPVIVPKKLTVYEFGWANGTVVSGNIDVGLYDCKGYMPDSRLVNSGTVAQAGTSTLQVTSGVADTVLTPGYYFLALQWSSATATFLGNSQAAANYRVSGWLQEAAGSFGLPATATPAAYATKNFGTDIVAFCRSVF